MSEVQDNKNSEKAPPRRGRTAILVATGLLCVALVFLLGLYQFRTRAREPIDRVRNLSVPGTDTTIGEGILEFLDEHGVAVADEGFKPSWGAEEVDEGEWVVSYVFEVSRRSVWVSWRVGPGDEEVVPLDDLARQLTP